MGKSFPYKIGVALLPDLNWWDAIKPLLEQGEIEALESSFDMLWGRSSLPSFINELLQEYSSRKSLYGHGVYLSLFSGLWSEHHTQWLEMLSTEVLKYQYQHVSEHFGFSVTKSFSDNAPLPVPLDNQILDLFRPRVAKLAESVNCRIGFENLALSLVAEDILEQGKFLGELVSPHNGFILLDLHNLFCQICNFDIDPLELLLSYPVERVTELHVSGGSWAQHNGKLIRRDTHDGPIPDEVFQLLKMALKIYPNVEVIIFERITNSLQDAKERNLFRADFFKIKEACYA